MSENSKSNRVQSLEPSPEALRRMKLKHGFLSKVFRAGELACAGLTAARDPLGRKVAHTQYKMRTVHFAERCGAETAAMAATGAFEWAEAGPRTCGNHRPLT